MLEDITREVREWRDDPKYADNPVYTRRWNRVLIALGAEPANDTPMSLEESNDLAYRWSRASEALLELDMRRANELPPEQEPEWKERPAYTGPRDIEVKKYSVQDIIQAFTKSSLSNLQPMFLDQSYFVPTWEQWQEIISWNRSEEPVYVPERRDCDDYAKYFAGAISLNWGVNACGIVVDVSSAHAYCAIFIDTVEGLGVGLLEPQTDESPMIGEANYKAQSGYVIF